MIMDDPLFRALRVPAIIAPSRKSLNPQFLVESCWAGAIGCLPYLDQYSPEDYESCLAIITASLDTHLPLYACNLSIDYSRRTQQYLDVIIGHRVPMVITLNAINKDIVQAVHSYSGIVLHHVSRAESAERAIRAGADGVVLYGTDEPGGNEARDPVRFLTEMRAIVGRKMLVTGCATTGASVYSSIAAGADLTYLGRRSHSATAEPNRRLLLSVQAERRAVANGGPAASATAEQVEVVEGQSAQPAPVTRLEEYLEPDTDQAADVEEAHAVKTLVNQIQSEFVATAGRMAEVSRRYLRN